MYGKDFVTCFYLRELVVQVSGKLILIFVEVFFCGFGRGVKQLFQSKYGMGFTGSVCALDPDGNFLFACNYAYGIANKPYKRFVGVELFPEVGFLVYYRFVDLREVLRVYIEVIYVFSAMSVPP